MQVPVAYVYDAQGYLTHIRMANSDTGKCRNIAMHQFLAQHYKKTGLQGFVGTFPLATMRGTELVDDIVQAIDPQTLHTQGFVKLIDYNGNRYTLQAGDASTTNVANRRIAWQLCKPEEIHLYRPDFDVRGFEYNTAYQKYAAQCLLACLPTLGDKPRVLAGDLIDLYRGKIIPTIMLSPLLSYFYYDLDIPSHNLIFPTYVSAINVHQFVGVKHNRLTLPRVLAEGKLLVEYKLWNQVDLPEALIATLSPTPQADNDITLADYPHKELKFKLLSGNIALNIFGAPDLETITVNLYGCSLDIFIQQAPKLKKVIINSLSTHNKVCYDNPDCRPSPVILERKGQMLPEVYIGGRKMEF